MTPFHQLLANDPGVSTALKQAMGLTTAKPATRFNVYRDWNEHGRQVFRVMDDNNPLSDSVASFFVGEHGSEQRCERLAKACASELNKEEQVTQ